MSTDPVLVGISLSPTHIPAMNLACHILRELHPQDSDAVLLERLLFAGICATISDNPREFVERRLA